MGLSIMYIYISYTMHLGILAALLENNITNTNPRLILDFKVMSYITLIIYPLILPFLISYILTTIFLNTKL